MPDVFTYSDLQPPEGLSPGNRPRCGQVSPLRCFILQARLSQRVGRSGRELGCRPGRLSQPDFARDLCRYRRVGLLAGQRSVLAGGYVYNDVSFQYPAMRSAEKPTYESLFPYEFRKQRHLRQQGDRLTLDLAPVCPRLPDKALIITSTELINFGSWIFRILPKSVVRSADTFQRTMKGYGADVVVPTDKAWKQEIIHRGAPDARPCAQDTRNVYALRDAAFLTQPVRTACFRMDTGRDPGHGAGAAWGIRCDARICLPAALVRVRKTRSLINEAEVETALAARGFAIHRPEDHSLAENARVFAGADVVVGPSGAGMFNAIFCRPRTTIIEIEQSASWRSTHANLYRSAGLRFGFVDNRKGLLHSHGFGHDSYWTEIPRLLSVVDQIIRKSRREGEPLD